jgi:sugar phosphate isomerase/epimerase
MTMSRRELLGSALLAATQLKAAAPNALRNIGGAPAGFPIRSKAARTAGQTFDFVDHCHSLGLGVVETRLPQGSPADLRRQIESYGMRLILDVGFPRDESGVAGFDASVKAAKECGAVSLHAAMTGRRYEDFKTFDAFKQSFEKNQHSIEMAEPILRKHKLPLGIENHKGWRSAEQAAWLKRVSSEWIGVHFDYGNNLSLCEDPMETLRNLLPFTIACHLKDMALEMYEDGFLLSEVPLGEGMLDLKGMTAKLKAKDPNMPLDLEMITRDPLKIPIFTDGYWVTFDNAYSPLPGRDVARVVGLIRENKPKNPLPRTANLSPEAQLKLEDECISKSIEYARRFLAD